ncbi:MAG: 3'-5' exonuclease [Deltaproteobacteria bacterium]|jgi:DNA polymerase-3 subunit epsilon|nr:3'-5' exonuclease [Deltaproteobacteria bacterium]
MQKLVFIDVETTGVNPERNGLIQISGCVQIDNQIVESFDFFVRPFPNDEIEEQALRVTGIDHRQLLPPGAPGFLQVPGQEFCDPHDVYARLQVMFGRYVDQYDKTDKFQFVGYNAHSFDMPFLRSFWQKNGDRFFGSWFWYPCLDVMLIWAQLLQPKRSQLADFKLATVARHCQIDVDENRLHDSQYDIELTRKLWLKACDMINLKRFEPTAGIQGELF